MNGMLGSGFPIAAEAFDLEIYQLACTFAASQELSLLSRTNPGLARVCNVFQLSEASRRLISVAAMIRSAMDTWSASAQRNLDTPVGELQSNTEYPETTVALGFREACNKILHADDIELLSDSNGDSILLNYDVVLTGRRGQEEWSYNPIWCTALI